MQFIKQFAETKGDKDHAKYDGLRCQIPKFKEWGFSDKEAIWFKHIKKEENSSLFEIKKKKSYVRLFTRNLEDITDMFPEGLKARPLIWKLCSNFTWLNG